MTTAEIKYWLLNVMIDGQAYNVSPDQVEQIKALWEELHEDPKVVFSFNEGLTKIKKHDFRKRIIPIRQ